MLQLRDMVVVDRLVSDPHEILITLRDFVRCRALVGDASPAKDWREMERSFGDESAFLDFSARRGGGQSRVLIEFGVHHGGERHRVGFFDAYWDEPSADFGQILVVSINRQLVDLDDFSDVLPLYLMLLLTHSEVAPAV